MTRRKDDDGPLSNDPEWYKDAIIYELHVRAFFDSNGDGIGDFEGLVEKLDYLQDLGVTALWLLPFYPSPLRDDGYDIADYTQVNPAYGNLRDFRRFLREAHRRGLRVITELVINHTSVEHPWFQRARRAKPGSRFRDFYVWSDTPERYQDARIIFKDFEASNWSWDPVAHAYYWHRFYSHQPDLNFENPEVQRAVFRTLDHWMDMGVDGLRLDAVPYLYEREGTNCENLPETHAFLKKLRKHIDSRYKNRMLLAEANQWPEDAAAYFGDGDECHMNFHFPVMPRMFMAVQLENSFPILDILDQTPAIPENSQWAVFLRNHDELTLEMVTDEDRDYMYRMYASDPAARINLGIRRRLAPLLKVRRKIELMNGLLFSLPGTPVLYYGDEIGMGDNIYLGDRDGVRTPMQWSSDRNAGFSRANPQKLYLPVIIDPEYHFEAVNVEAQQQNPASLLWWMKRLIALRKQYHVFGRGTIEFLHPDNPKVLAFIRKYQDEQMLCVFNLSRFPQYVELDLKSYEGMTPTELFGQTEFPAIGELPYLLTLGAHAFYWFSLERAKSYVGEFEAERYPLLETSGSWETVLEGSGRAAFERWLPDCVVTRRWFRSKAKKIKSAEIVDAVPLSSGTTKTQIAFVEIEFIDGGSEVYVLPLAFASGEEEQRIEQERPDAVLVRLRVKVGEGSRDGILYDPLATGAVAESLLAAFGKKKALAGKSGQVQVTTYRSFRGLRSKIGDAVRSSVIGAEQSNTSVAYDDSLILKIYRRVEEGINPDLEISRFLSEKAGFEHTPPLAGALEYRKPGGEPAALGILQSYVPNQGDAWSYTLDALDRFYERALARREDELAAVEFRGGLLDHREKEFSSDVADLLGPYVPLVRLLGRRTAEMHLALASDAEDPAFAPEPFSLLYQRSIYQTARTRLRQTFHLLRGKLRGLPEEVREAAKTVLDAQIDLDARLKRIHARKIESFRIRCHGDYHLGQVLYTGKDFVIIDFEGEPARPLGERRFKRSPLLDVSGMLRSYHYAAITGLRNRRVRPDDVAVLSPYAEVWTRWISAAFLDAYLATAGDASFIPGSREDLETLLEFFLLDKSVYELGYELNNRPEWIAVPIEGLRSILRSGDGE